MFFFRCNYENCNKTAQWLAAHTNVQPKVAIICGSGLGGLSELLSNKAVFPYQDIPHFPRSTGMHYSLAHVIPNYNAPLFIQLYLIYCLII